LTDDEVEQQGNEMAMAPPEAEMVSDRQARKNWILALILLLIYITLVVASSQLTSSAFNDDEYRDYKAPYLFIWCKICMRTLAFPSVFLIQTLVRLAKRQPIGAREQWQ
jgi:lipid II:glycine glycyltransferase (peptidoglycan interpeptide bridge formation enzyme)